MSAKKILKSAGKYFFKNQEINLVSLNSTQNSIKFYFNTPSLTYHGGLWEAAVKSMKYHLQRVVGETEEYNTVTTKIEAILKSCPITPLFADPSDLSTISPGLFS